jgi:hypothetical protein
MKRCDIWLGTKHVTNEGYEIEVIEYNNYHNCKVLFSDGHTKNTNLQQIKSGQVRNDYRPSNQGVGFIGDGIYSSNKNRRCYEVWSGLIKRGYSPKVKEKQPTYKDVTVCEEWHNFQNFAKWFEENYNPEIMQDWDLDKDILLKGNKVYSPETCAFVPPVVNTLFVKRGNKRGCLPIGVRKIDNCYVVRLNKHNESYYLGSFKTSEEAFNVYKVAKEEYIKEVAEKWKGIISDKVYQALYNYKVEITD